MQARIGIIGTGNRGVNAFGKLLGKRSDCELVALCDANAARLEAAQNILRRPLALYTEVEGMLAQEALDAVVITSPDYLHARLTMQALRAGVKHVLVDKPLATTAEDCWQVSQVAHECGGQVMVGFNLREAPLIARIKQVIENGDIGDLMLMENREFYDGGRTYMARWNRFYALSGGLWVHKGTHDFDVFNWWNAEGNPQRVSASAGLNALRADKLPFEVETGKVVGPNCSSCAYADVCPDYSAPASGPLLQNETTQAVDGYVQDLCIFLSEKDTHDNGIALVEYDNNVRATHAECFVCGFTDRIYTLTGDKGTIFANLEQPERIELRPRWGAPRFIDVPPAPDGGHGGADPLLVQRFVRSLSGETTGAGLRDGMRAVAVGQAAEIASREHRMVNLPELMPQQAWSKYFEGAKSAS